MTKPYRRQDQTGIDPKDNPKGRGLGFEAVVPNPKLKLMDQVREVMRLRHYSMHTERSYCNWILRFIRFHQMKSRADLEDAETKIEAFLSHLAVNGQGGRRHAKPGVQRAALSLPSGPPSRAREY